MLFYFDEDLLPYTNNTPTVEVAGSTLVEGLVYVCNQFPSLYVHLVAGNGSEAGKYVLILNDEELLEIEDLTKPLTDKDEINILGVVPSGEAGALGAAVINFFAGAGTVTATSVVAQIVGSVILVGVMMALNTLIGALMGDMAAPSIYSGSLDNSASYTFTGIKNTTASGTPIQIVYGEHRTGGQVLSLFTKSDDTPTTVDGQKVYRTDTFLYYQLGVSEGEIAGISNIEINKLPASFYNAVDFDYRPGQSLQTPMLDFEESRTTTSIGRKVLNIDQTLTAVPVTYTSYTPVYGHATWLSPGYTIGKYVINTEYVDENTGG